MSTTTMGDVLSEILKAERQDALIKSLRADAVITIDGQVVADRGNYDHCWMTNVLGR